MVGLRNSALCWCRNDFAEEGTSLAEFLRSNLIVVQFLYGLIFFSLGLAIVVQPRRNSVYDLAKQLDWLAVFAFAHAFSDWGNLFIPLQEAWAPPVAVAVFWTLKVCMAAISFTALLHFGISLLVLPGRRTVWLLGPVVLLSLWFALFVAKPLVFGGDALNNWWLPAQIGYRYMLGFPGALLTAAGLWAQAGSIEVSGKHVRFLKLASVGFVLYSLTAGLIVPEHPVFPASVINKNAFQQLVGIPIELIRWLIMCGITYFTVRLMDVFTVETHRRLQRAEQERALLREREQIARELHDGIMQTLYGTGLGLKQVMGLAATNPEVATAMISELSLEIGRSIIQMRRFVLDLKEEGTTPDDIRREVFDLCAQFEQDTPFPISVDMQACADKERRVPGGLREDVISVVREGLVAGVRHAQTKWAHVVVSLDVDTFLVRVTTQGQGAMTPGFEIPTTDALRERIEAAGGLLTLITEDSCSQLIAHLPISRGARPRDWEGTRR